MTVYPCTLFDQLSALRNLTMTDDFENTTEPMVNNFRPVQPLNGRTVLRRESTYEPTTTEPGGGLGGSGGDSAGTFYCAIIPLLTFGLVTCA